MEIPGDHNSILKDPNARILADQIMAYLKPGIAVPAETSVR